MPKQGPFIPVPNGAVVAENPDGITTTRGESGQVNSHNLWDTNGHPDNPSGDWQVDQVYQGPRNREGTT